MIITVSMNPAIDKTVEIEALQPGGLNRIQKAKELTSPKPYASWEARALPPDFWEEMQEKLLRMY